MNCGSEEKFGKVLGSSFFVEKTRNEERRTKNNSGVTLIGFIAAIVIMGLLGAGVLMLVTTGSMESIFALNWGQSFFAAESGVSAARAYMATNATWYTNSSTITGVVGQASFSAIVDTDGKVTSVGSKDEAQWKSMWRPTWHAMLVYENSSSPKGTPRYRIWGGTNWSAPSNALSVGNQNINWVVVKACPKRDEYIAATIDAKMVVTAQVYSNGIWTNPQTIATNLSANNRGVDIAYESLSGDAIVVAANKTTNATYYVWKTNTWTMATVNLSRTNVPIWIKLASDPVSDEIIVMVQDAKSNYTAKVWNGSNAWEHEQRPVALSANTNYESMAVEYETSGDQAIIVSANATAASFKWNSWNGTAWSNESTIALGTNFTFGTLVNDPNSDKLLFTYVGTNKSIGAVFWDGSKWGAYSNLTTSGKTNVDRCVQGQFETISTNAGHALVAYSDTVRGLSRHALDPSNNNWQAAVTAAPAAKGYPTVQTRRTGDGKILAMWFDRTNYFSWHDGTAWSAKETLETKSSVTATPFKEPFMMAPQLWVLP